MLIFPIEVSLNESYWWTGGLVDWWTLKPANSHSLTIFSSAQSSTVHSRSGELFQLALWTLKFRCLHPLREASAYGRLKLKSFSWLCPFMGGVPLQEVSVSRGSTALEVYTHTVKPPFRDSSIIQTPLVFIMDSPLDSKETKIHINSTSIIRTALYYGQLTLGPKRDQTSYKLYLYNTNTSLLWTAHFGSQKRPNFI